MKANSLQMFARYIAVATFVLALLTFSSCDDEDDSGEVEVGISKISLYLDFNFTATGNIILTVRDPSNKAIVGTSSVSVEGFQDANDGWIDFEFADDVDIKKATTYQIEVKRSKPNVPYSDVVLWHGAADDVYAHGDSRVEGSTIESVGDFAFKIFVDGVVDQQQEVISEVNLLGDNKTHIQEFMVGH